MVFKLMKELPQLFVIAAIIWGFVLYLFVRNGKKKDLPFFTRHKTTLLASSVGLVLTIADIWLFIQYIPTHFKKHTEAAVTLPAADLLIDSVLIDSIHKPAAEPRKGDSAAKGKAPAADSTAKILITNKASVHFLSHGSSEDIEAINQQVACSVNEKTGAIKFTGLIKGFVFENELMQDHFNSKDYMNSDMYPKTNFTGNIQPIQTVNFAKDGNYPVTATGALTIRGVTQNITASGSLIVSGNKVTLKSVFKIKRADFKIDIEEIAEVLEITVDAAFN